MKIASKLSILFVLLLSTTLAFAQCETYLQKAETLFAQKKYEDAKRQYSNYKECKPNATGIDTKIAECERLLKENTNTQTNNSSDNRIYQPTSSRTYGGRGTDNPTVSNNETQKPERIPGKVYIGIGSFSGYKSDQAKNDITSAFVGDGRFIVTQVQNSGYRNNQQTSLVVDYIISGTSECTQQARTTYTNIPSTKYSRAMSIPNTTSEIVTVVITLTNAGTGQIVVNSNYSLNSLNRISGDIFPVKFTVNKVDDGKIGIVNITGGTYYMGDEFNVYEEYGNGGKSFLGKLKIGKTNNDCKISDGKKEINNRFKAGAKLVVEK